MRNILFALLFLLFTQTTYGGIGDSLLTRGSIKTSFDYHLQLNHLDISPSVLFLPNSRIEAGAGLNYLYYYRGTTRTSRSSTGMHAFVRYFPFEKVFLHGEYLFMRVPYRRDLDYSYNKVSLATVLAGAGYRQPFSDKLSGYLYFLLDLNHSELSAYNSKVLVKAGISF